MRVWRTREAGDDRQLLDALEKKGDFFEAGEIAQKLGLGGTRTLRVDVRIIAATNRNLTQMVQEGRFREDLYYRLNVVSVETPPLRDRKDDIPALAVSRADAARLQRGQAVLLRGRDAPNFRGTVYVTVSGQLLALAELDRGEIVPKRVFNLAGLLGRAARKKG